MIICLSTSVCNRGIWHSLLNINEKGRIKHSWLFQQLVCSWTLRLRCVHWGLPAFGSIREPGGAHAEVALALLAAARTSRARVHAPPTLQKFPSKQRTNASFFYTPNQTAQLLLRACFPVYCNFSRGLFISPHASFYALPLRPGRVFVWVLLINHFLGQISGAGVEGGEVGRCAPCSPPSVAPDGAV